MTDRVVVDYSALAELLLAAAQRPPDPVRLGVAVDAMLRSGTSPAPSGWLTIGEAAKRFRVSERTVRRWVAAGELEAVKVGGTVRIPVNGGHRRSTADTSGSGVEGAG